MVANHVNVKNGPYELVIAPEGYPGKRYRGRYAYEHHIVWWLRTGQAVQPGFEVHHKNEQKRDNRFDNLEYLSGADHRKGHGEKLKRFVTTKCAFCEKDFEISPRQLKSRLKRYPALHCSRSCSVKNQWKKGLAGGKRCNPK
jgi:hypothetical protein